MKRKKYIQTEWDSLVESSTSTAPYEFAMILNALVEPYSDNELLEPIDRKEILLDLKESLNLDCEISNDCNNNDICQFCDNVAFNILDVHKHSPSSIIKDISFLSENS